MFDTLDRGLLAICRFVSGISFVFMGLIAFADAIARLIRVPLVGTSEFVEFALIVFFFATLPLIVRDDDQIRVGLLTDLYRPKLKRMEQLFTLAVEIFSIIVITYMMWDQAARLLRFGTVTAYYQLPVAPWVYLSAAFASVAIWIALRNLVRPPPAEPAPRPHAIPDDEAPHA